MKKIKEEDLILYIYNECPPRLRAAIDRSLEEDIELQDQLKTLKRTVKQLDKLSLRSPSKKSIQSILKQAQESLRKK